MYVSVWDVAEKRKKLFYHKCLWTGNQIFKHGFSALQSSRTVLGLVMHILNVGLLNIKWQAHSFKVCTFCCLKVMQNILSQHKPVWPLWVSVGIDLSFAADAYLYKLAKFELLKIHMQLKLIQYK